MLRKIKNDVHKIAERIRKIDENYEIYYNIKNHEYELHHKKQKKDLGYGLVLVLPFNRLDKRTLDYCLKTRACNVDIEHYSENLEKENNKMVEKKHADFIDRLEYETKEIIKYVDKSATREWID